MSDSGFVKLGILGEGAFGVVHLIQDKSDKAFVSIEATSASLRNFLHTFQRERNVLFNDALNTFYLRLSGVRHMVKDHSDSEKGNTLPPHRLLLSINSKGSFICTRITHTTAFVTPVVEHWLEREIAQWVHPMKDRSVDPPRHERTLYLHYVRHYTNFSDCSTLLIR